ncbi:MAG: hypothetical protein ACT4NT_03335 [Nitrososphaerota archaeon]
MSHDLDDIARQMISDPIQFKIAMARHFLDKIPKKIPESYRDHMALEANIDSFLFFASSVIDVIKREINEKFELFDKDNVFYIHGLRKRLADSGKQKMIKKIIADYFTTPSRKQDVRSSLNTKQSSLWRLQILRNKVTHGHILKSKVRKTFKITYTVRQYKQRNESSFEFEESVQNPKKYFGQIFEDLTSFVKKTRRIILPKTKSGRLNTWH